MSDPKRWRVLAELIQQYYLQTMVEVGCGDCQTARRILQAACLRSYVGVDPYESYEGYNDVPCAEPSVLQSNLEKAQKLQEDSEVFCLLRKPSLEAVLDIDDESVGLIFIDANHEYRYVWEDLHLWWPKVSPKGVLSCHDYGGGKHGVTKAVRAFVEELSLEAWNASYDGVWYSPKWPQS